MSAVEPSPHARRRIARLVDQALRESEALGVLPTPLEALRAAAALEIVEAPGLRPEVLGAIWFEERTVFVAGAQSVSRRRFTEAHEIAHALCGWHYAALREDTASSLFGPARDAIEAEANAGAAMLIFQGEAFRERAAGLPCTLQTVRTLAEAFGASLHATLHHYVQTSPLPVAMLTVGRFRRSDGTLPVWRRVVSPGFPSSAAGVPGTAAGGVLPGSPLDAVIEAARTSGDAGAVLGEAPGALQAEAHYNRHAFLVLVRAAQSRVGMTPRGSRSLQRRDVQPVQPAAARPCHEPGPAPLDRGGVRAQDGVDRRAARASRR